MDVVGVHVKEKGKVDVDSMVDCLWDALKEECQIEEASMDEWSNVLNGMTESEIGTVRKFMRGNSVANRDGGTSEDAYIESFEPAHPRIVNGIVDILTRNQHKLTPYDLKFWLIPTTVTRPRHGVLYALHNRMEWNPWIGPLWQCRKIYLRIISQQHWLVAFVDMQERIVFVRDNLDIPAAKLGLAIIAEILIALDSVLMDERHSWKGRTWSFKDFPILQHHCIPDKCRENDCGIYVIKAMQATVNGDVLCNHDNPLEERACVALQMTMSRHNKFLRNLMYQATTLKERIG
ncbi:Ulp1 protease family, C-terminal catalytic domain containing protein [Parasponia andersonii]|uniref:Ulp1 protease family, C-terminal catalytic domain containing protein n=1 Tax=Parasponia andersonii TaxID=3476 RepID=A0A2P5CU92_PARAD|nr:Ulp1 protease family, C-terminal catalytic domain containing protein [Parasponia andersonii]